MIQDQTMKWHLEDLTQANAAMLGIGQVLEEINRAESAGDVCVLAHNGQIKGCLVQGIEALTSFVDIKLEMMAELVG